MRGGSLNEMRVLAYCDQSFEIVTRKVAGGDALVITCPPTFGAEFVARSKQVIEAADLIIFNFDAVPNRTAWYLQNGEQVITADQLNGLDLSRAVIFLMNCYQGGAVLDTLKAMKPRAIIGGAGENLGGRTKPVGTDIMALWFRRWLFVGLSPARALEMAKARLKIGAQTASVKDAQKFEVIV